jgi:hypothetical protein
VSLVKLFLSLVNTSIEEKNLFFLKVILRENVCETLVFFPECISYYLNYRLKTDFVSFTYCYLSTYSSERNNKNFNLSEIIKGWKMVLIISLYREWRLKLTETRWKLSGIEAGR